MSILAIKRTLDKSKIVKMATQLINEEGINALTMPNLAKKLGIRSQSLYHYVANRKELLGYVCADRIKELRKHLLTKVIGVSGEKAIFTFADEIRDFLRHDRAMTSILYSLEDLTSSPAIEKEILQIVDLGKKLDVDRKNIVSLHSLLAGVLGYVYLDQIDMFKDESPAEADDNYHEMLLRLVAPKLKASAQ